MRKIFNVEYSIKDLQRLIERPLIHKPLNFYNGCPIHLVCDIENLSGEIFKEGMNSQIMFYLKQVILGGLKAMKKYYVKK